ncbi:MAG: UDP-N-acetylglucosamine 2-epimerase (non-hydrolyzing) [Bacteroidales bacterium]|nr:UDP-N-acetylglucosamine 2-epimerase (non-hydrolyzing) [Bacteroidales bacterium]
MKKIIHVVGARPNFMKIAPIMEEMGKFPDHFQQLLVHTGQHYDREMSKVFFEDLGLPEPDIYLGVGSGSHARQTAEVMVRFEDILLEESPDLVLVVGDVNSTLACALVTSKLYVPVAHVEAGLRSFDRDMPEEINRVLTDQISDLLFTTEIGARENLLREGIQDEKIHFVGNVMIDTLLANKEQALAQRTFEEYGLQEGEYILLTLHRPSNVDDQTTLEGILYALMEIQRDTRILFPAHPRTTQRIQEFGFHQKLEDMNNMTVAEPLGYLSFLDLMAHARLVLTDSGGIQEETTILDVPCLTLRENTERPVTIKEGTNQIIGNKPEVIISETKSILNASQKTTNPPEKWDGQAASRIVSILRREGFD